MARKSGAFVVIGYGLASLYALLMFMAMSRIGGDGLQVVLFSLIMLCAILMVSAIAATKLKERARKLLVTCNFVLVAFLVILTLTEVESQLGLDALGENFPWGYVFIATIAAFYYSLSQTRSMFVDRAGTRKSVLVVDDDPGLIKTVKPVLLANGFSVLTANTGERGLQIAEKQAPDLIVLDVILPGIKGREVCSKLKENSTTQRIPVIFLTAKDSPDDIRAEIEVGGISHMTKPFSSQKLLEEVQKILGS